MKKTLFFLLAILGATCSAMAQQATAAAREQLSSSPTKLVGKLVNENGEPITGLATITLGNQNI